MGATAWVETVQNGFDSARPHWDKMLSMASHGGDQSLPTSASDALMWLFFILVDLWDHRNRDPSAAVGKVDKALRFLDDLDELDRVSPDHAHLWTMCGLIKNAAGFLEEARSDAGNACQIYTKLGGMEFRYSGSTGCDVCGMVKMLMAILKYKEGDEQSAAHYYHEGARICNEVGNLKFVLCMIGLASPGDEDILLQLGNMADC